jgi:hypothetical protein
MGVNFLTTSSIGQIKAAIKKEIASHFFSVLNIKSKTIEKDAKKLFLDSVRSTKEYDSLLSGELLHQLGLTNTTTKLAIILDQWLSSITVVVNKSIFKAGSSTLKKTLEIRGVQGDWQDVLSLQEAKQITEKGQQLEWLLWLLTVGDKVIIKGYDIVNSPRGRAGKYIMAKKNSSWSVPGVYSGRTTKNFITDAIDGSEQKFLDMIQIRIEEGW